MSPMQVVEYFVEKGVPQLEAIKRVQKMMEFKWGKVLENGSP